MRSCKLLCFSVILWILCVHSQSPISQLHPPPPAAPVQNGNMQTYECLRMCYPASWQNFPNMGSPGNLAATARTTKKFSATTLLTKNFGFPSGAFCGGLGFLRLLATAWGLAQKFFLKEQGDRRWQSTNSDRNLQTYGAINRNTCKAQVGTTGEWPEATNTILGWGHEQTQQKQKTQLGAKWKWRKKEISHFGNCEQEWQQAFQQ